MTHDVQFGDMKVPVHEAVNGAMTGRDISDTNDEMWKTRNKVAELMGDMTLDECRKLVEIADEYKRSIRSKVA